MQCVGHLRIQAVPNTHAGKTKHFLSSLCSCSRVFVGASHSFLCGEFQISYSQTHLEDPGLNQYK